MNVSESCPLCDAEFREGSVDEAIETKPADLLAVNLYNPFLLQSLQYRKTDAGTFRKRFDRDFRGFAAHNA